jgi:Aspartyl protease
MKRVHVRVNGTPAWMILDTGGGWSIASPSLAKSIGCKPFGQITGFRMSGEKIATQQCGQAGFDLAGVAGRGGWPRRVPET